MATGSDSWVEWSYIIDFKENTLSVHGTADQPPIKVYNLSDLPTEEVFIKELEGEEVE